jgi:PAS domain S-box-containing protein
VTVGNNVAHIILLSLPGAKTIEVNPALEEIMGGSRDELLSMKIEKRYAHREERQAILGELATTGGGISRQLHWEKKGGNKTVALNKVIPIRAGAGQILYSDTVIKDFTERKRMAKALRESEAKYRTLVENATDLIYMIDADYRILSLNRSTARLLGKEPEELIGKKIFDIAPPETAARVAEEFRLAFKTGKTIMAEAKLNPGGREMWASINLSPIRNDNNEVVAVMGVTRDITEHKRMERELQEKNEQLDIQNEELRTQSEELIAQQHELIESTEEAARANRLKSEFMANMSHELRTPLNTIIGFSRLMRDQVPGKINQEQKQCLDDILESSQHLLNLTNEVLNLSKIESDRTELKLENLTLTELITPLTRSMMPILQPKKQSLEVEIEEDLPRLHADKNKLGQVLRNLLTNSSKFTPDEGKLKIEANSSDDWLRLSVIDNGIGIKKEDQERIFEPFCQLDYTPSNGKSDTGLGLAVVKRIVKKHGGQIRVESEYGRGSRFTISLPLATK